MSRVSWCLRALAVVVFVGVTISSCFAQVVSAKPPSTDPSRLTPHPSPLDPPLTTHQSPIDEVIEQSIARGEMPGAVVLVLHKDQVVLRKAYGLRSKQPVEVPMTPDTVFDLASLTKPIATATSIFVLIDQGKLRLTDRVTKHLPKFGRKGKESITVADLLLHVSGLIADNPESDYSQGPEAAFDQINRLIPLAVPGKRFVYSDVGFIVLGELVQKLSGVPLDEFAETHVFGPLGMTDTCFRPNRRTELLPRLAPTQRRNGHWMVGEVHDPRAYALGGVAGDAGLFSTADDLAIYTRMLLHSGELNGRRVLSTAAVQSMTTPHPVPGGLRAYGWDVDTSYSRNRGDLFPRGKSFGHTGFTGTSIWIDPGSATVVIFLSNRVHPDGKGNVTRVRGQVATLAASAVLGSQPNSPLTTHYSPLTLTGIDVLARERFQRLQGRHIGLVTNHSGLDREGRSTIDLLHNAKGVTLVALFSPEHGIRGTADEKIGDSRDEKTGLPIYSLYGARHKPTTENLKGIDTLVYDIQDAGCRFYTYISTLGYVLEGAAENKLKVVVLDRPNPIGGVTVSGPVLDPGRESFVGYHRLPVRHGLTVGELARLFNAERKIGADLEVVTMDGWHRDMLFDQTGLTWINPSPNLRSLTETLLYPGIGLLETTNLSVGRGTDRPFEWIGAPWLDGQKLAAALQEQKLPGLRFVPLRLTPNYSVHKGQTCGGVQFITDDWKTFEPVQTGLAIACTLRRLYPHEWQVDSFNKLLGHQATWEGVKGGASWRELPRRWQPELDKFIEIRKRYLLYR
jgi:uncharacterized protein YbbC (DUF1343 family)/CubicO group peptidase (beta-lactamase class C family)